MMRFAGATCFHDLAVVCQPIQQRCMSAWGIHKGRRGEGCDSLPGSSHCIDEADRLSSEGLLVRAAGAVLRNENDFR